MAIQNQHAASAIAATPMAQAFQQATTQQQSTVQTKTTPMSFMSMGLSFGLGRAATTHEALNKAITAFKESIKKGYEERQIDPSFEISLLALDSTKGTGVRYSGIIVATTHKEMKNVVSIHTVLVEGSADPIMPKIETSRGVQYEVLLTAGDTIDRSEERRVGKEC